MTRSVLNASRGQSTTAQETPFTEDWDGNILAAEASQKYTFFYSPDAIPAERLENLLKLMTVPSEWHMSLTLLHQHTQGKKTKSYKIYKNYKNYKNRS